MQLTENFSLHELTKSETALRHGLDNTPGDDEINNLKTRLNMAINKERSQYKMGTGL